MGVEFIIVKGGETKYSVGRLWQGQKSDKKLTENGLKSACELAEKIVQLNPDLIITSSTKRNWQTAEKIKEKGNLLYEIDKQFDSRRINPFEGKEQAVVDAFYLKATQDTEKRNADEMFEERFIEGIRNMDPDEFIESYETLTTDPSMSGKTHTVDELKKYTINGIETNQELKKRVQEGLESLSKRYEGKKVVIVTHTDLIRTIIRIYKNLDISKDFKVDNHAVLRLTLDGNERWKVFYSENEIHSR